MSCFNRRKTLFLDRDGVINVDKNYLYKIEDFEFFSDTKYALKEFQEMGFQLIVITNQSGIARGYYTVKDYKKLTKYYLRLLKEYGIKKVKVLFCPHLPDAKVKKYKKDCNCRKPKIGLFEKAIKKYKVDIENSFAVGDKERDLEVCKKYKGIKGYLINNKSKNFKTLNCLSELVNEIKKNS